MVIFKRSKHTVFEIDIIDQFEIDIIDQFYVHVFVFRQ